jgi:hypothetical protein
MLGWTLNDVIDFLVKLSPAATIIGAIVAAKIQFGNLQRINALTIAKNHYREMMELMLKNADLFPATPTPEAYEALKVDPVRYRRYIMLFAIVSFAMQEIYFATDPKRNPHWAEVIRMFMAAFRPFTTSADFTAEMHKSVHPEFDDFVGQMLRRQAGTLPGLR